VKKEQIIFLEKIEAFLLSRDIHSSIVKDIMNFLLNKTMSLKKIIEQDIVLLLEAKLKSLIRPYLQSFNINCQNVPYVMLFCGINGSGKTTTIGKMTALLKQLDWSVVVASCDTFRSAANDQLSILVKNNTDDFICKENDNETPTRVAVKALNIAMKKRKDILLIDTSGRLQNNQDLMAELLKMKQKLKEQAMWAPNEVILVIDTNCGNSALQQARIYNDLIGITGVIATKADISKRFGSVFSICCMYKIPLYGITNGEKSDDIEDLDTDEFVKQILKGINALFTEKKTNIN
jgi:fused signal recognition particle receptor